MERLIAQDAIMQTLYRMAYAEDELDKEAMLDLFKPDQPFLFDVSDHLNSLPVMEITPEDLWNSVNLHLSGFTATQHMLGNPQVTFASDKLDKATAKAQVNAYHCLEAGGKIESVTARGMWHVDVEYWEGKWVCSKIVIRRDVPLDNAQLYEVAKGRAERGEGRKAKQST